MFACFLVDDFVVFLSAFVDSMPVQLLVLMAQVTRTEPFSGQLFYRGQLSPCTLTFHHLHAPPSYFSSLLCPSVIFLVRSHSSCVSIKGGGARRGERGGSEQKSFTAWLCFIYQHQVFSARCLKSQLRNLSPGPANKEPSSTFPVRAAFPFHQ